MQLVIGADSNVITYSLIVDEIACLTFYAENCANTVNEFCVIFSVHTMRYLLPIAFIILFTSCKKEPIEPTPDPVEEPCEPTINLMHSYDTVYPSEYIMAWPGSWWEYDNGHIDSCTSWDAVPVHYTTEIDGCKFVDEDMLYLPNHTLINAAHFYYDQVLTTPTDYSSSKFEPYIDTTIGIFLDYISHSTVGSVYWTYHHTKETLERLDSLVVGPSIFYDVIHIKHTTTSSYYMGPGPTNSTEYFFAKNTGLVKILREYNGSIWAEENLTNYYIAPH